jgi:hypothetical protein
MQKSKRIKVRGKQRVDIDPQLFVQVLIAIAQDWASEDKPAADSPDVFQAAIEDTEAAP